MSDKSVEDQRLDKWLWAARFFKTRSVATQAVNGGKVHCNGERTKPGKAVKIGDVLTVRKGVYEFEVVVEQLSRQRLPAPAARQLYTETEAGRQAREKLAEQMRIEKQSNPIPQRRPDKRDRRKLIDVKHKRD